MISIDHKWLQKTALSTVLLVVPAVIMISITWFRHAERAETKTSGAYAKLASTAVIVLFLASILNIIFNYSVGFMITWPAFGIVLVAFALGLSIAGPKRDRILLVSADLLLLVLCFTSIVLPN
jgi:hypothetical protein